MALLKLPQETKYAVEIAVTELFLIGLSFMFGLTIAYFILKP